MGLGELRSFVADLRRRELVMLDKLSRADWRELGYVHFYQFLKAFLNVGTVEAKKVARQIELLCPKVGVSGQRIEPQLPAVRAALAEGAVTREHVNRIAKVLDRVPESLYGKADADLAEAARQFTPPDLAKVGQRLLDAVDPDGPEPADPTVQERQNELDLREHEDGSLSGRFRVGRETAAHLKPLLSSLAAPQPGDDRTLIERQGDALAELIRFAADSGEAPVEGGERPHIAVTVSLETLQSGIGTATLDDGQSLTPEQTRRLACDAAIISMVLGTRSQPIDVGETKRIADVRLRRALAVRDKGCAVPGCCRTPRQCHAHHVQHWADGGPTTLANMVLVCHFHHRLIHHGGWQVHMDHGRPVFTPPAWLRPAA